MAARYQRIARFLNDKRTIDALDEMANEFEAQAERLEGEEDPKASGA
jgi:hypothetical protein